MNKTKDIREQIVEILEKHKNCIWWTFKKGETLAKKSDWDFSYSDCRIQIIDELANLLTQLEKAYGGCHNCYGKGYSTYRHATTASGDFEGEKDVTTPFKVHMNFCDCERGKQLQNLIEDERKEITKRLLIDLARKGQLIGR